MQWNKYLEGKDITRAEILHLCIGIEKVFKSHYGPEGDFLAITDFNPDSEQTNNSGAGHGSSFRNLCRISSCSEHIFHSSATLLCAFNGQQHIGNVHPSYLIIQRAVQAQIRECGDCGFYCAGLTASLVRASIESDFHFASFSFCADLALQWCLNYLRNTSNACVLPVKLSEAVKIKLLLRSVIGTKQLCRLSYSFSQKDNDGDGIEHIVTEVLKAFLYSLKTDLKDGSVQSNLHLMCIQGLCPSESAAFPNQIILDVSIPTIPGWFDVQTPCVGGLVAVYTTSLALEKGSGMPQLDFEIENEVWSVAQAENRTLCELVSGLSALGVKVVVSQKMIQPFMQYELLKCGIFPIERVSTHQVGLVLSISGAVPLSSLTVPSKSALGFVDSVQVSRIMQNKYYVIIKNKKVRISTLQICAVDTHAMEELRTVITNAIVVLKRFLTDSVLLSGGGATEVALAEHVRACARNELHNKRNANKKAIFESIAKVLELARLHRITENKETKLREKTLRCNSSVTPPLCALDLRFAKARALERAFKASIMLLRLQGTIKCFE